MENIFYTLRVEKGLSLRELHNETGVGVATLHRLEHFTYPTVLAKTLHKLSVYYNRDGNELNKIYLNQYNEYVKNQEE